VTGEREGGLWGKERGVGRERERERGGVIKFYEENEMNVDYYQKMINTK